MTLQLDFFTALHEGYKLGIVGFLWVLKENDNTGIKIIRLIRYRTSICITEGNRSFQGYSNL